MFGWFKIKAGALFSEYKAAVLYILDFKVTECVPVVCLSLEEKNSWNCWIVDCVVTSE